MTGHQPNEQFSSLLKHILNIKDQQPPDKILALVNGAYAAIQTFSDMIIQPIQAATDWYEREGKALFLHIAEMSRKWDENIPHWKEATMALSEKSWFISPYFGFGDLINLVDAVYKNPQTADDLLVSYYSQNLDEIIASIYSDFPCRAQIIADAVEAHYAKKYNLSIPVFLAQADGFCFDVNRSLFDGKNNNLTPPKKYPNYRPHIKHDANTILDAKKGTGIDSLLLPALGKIPNIALGEGERRKFQYTGLNRNMVLHGVDTQYGTHENSLKAFSFMAYIAGIVHSYRDEMEKTYPTSQEKG